jgi:hypothetical protein
VNPPPIFFIGFPRSGTTIISEIIFTHNELAWVSNYNVKFKNLAFISIFRRLFDNRFWRFIGQKKQNSKVSLLNKVLFTPAEGYPFWREVLPDHIDFSKDFLMDFSLNNKEIIETSEVIDSLVKLQGKSRFSAKFTGPSRIKFLKTIFPDAIFVNITRSYIDTISSLMNIGFWEKKGMNQLWWSGVYTEQEKNWVVENSSRSELIAALQYRKIRETTDEECALLSEKELLTISYESFVDNPEVVIKNILNFCNLHDDDEVFKCLTQRNIENRNTINKEKFSKSVIKEIETVIDNSLS